MAEPTSRQDGIFRQHLIERLLREIMKFDEEFRREEVAVSVAPLQACDARHRCIVTCGIIFVCGQLTFGTIVHLRDCHGTTAN